MDIGSEGVPDSQPEDDYSAGPSAPTSHLQQPSSEALHVLSYLTQRIVSCRSTAAQAMRLRPALAKGEQELTAALNSMVRDATSMSVLVLGDPGSGKTLVSHCTVPSSATHKHPPSSPHWSTRSLHIQAVHVTASVSTKPLCVCVRRARVCVCMCSS